MCRPKYRAGFRARLAFANERPMGQAIAGHPGVYLALLGRPAASGMASLAVRIETVEKILNHASGSFRGIVGGYQKNDFASEKRAALDLWAPILPRFRSPYCLVESRVTGKSTNSEKVLYLNPEGIEQWPEFQTNWFMRP